MSISLRFEKLRKSNYLDLLREFVITDFKLRYKHSILGVLWVIIKPLIIFGVLYTVWSSLMKTGENYALYLLIGVISIQLFNDGVLFGMQSLFNKAHIILKIDFPKEVVVLSAIAVGLINFSVNLVVFTFFAFFGHVDINLASILLFLLTLLTLLVLITGVSLFTSILSAKFYDLRHIIELSLQIVFWATPIFYNKSQLSPTLLRLVELNPLTTIIDSFRTALLSGSTINGDTFGAILKVLVVSIILAGAGILFFNNKITKVSEYY